MSEHMSMTGSMEFHHLPYDWPGGMVFCRRCKKISEKPTIRLDEGFRVSVTCHRCKKIIWAMKWGLYPADNEKEDVIIFPKDNRRCSTCGKATNEYDCYAFGFCTKGKKFTPTIFCSKKCDRISWKKVGKKRRG